MRALARRSLVNLKILLLLSTLALSGAVAAQSAEFNGKFPHAATSASLPTDRIIVKWRATATIASDTGAPRTAALQSVPALAGVQVRSTARIAPRIELLRLQQPMSAADLQQTLARLSSDPAVEYAVPDRRRLPHMVVPSDSLFSGQWYLQAAQLSAIRASSAWDTTMGSAGTVIAVLDTGVRFDHPDLGHAEQGGRLLPGYDFIDGESATSFLIANDGNGRDPDPSDPGDWVDASDSAERALHRLRRDRQLLARDACVRNHRRAHQQRHRHRRHQLERVDTAGARAGKMRWLRLRYPRRHALGGGPRGQRCAGESVSGEHHQHEPGRGRCMRPRPTRT